MRSRFQYNAKQKQKLFQDRYFLTRRDTFNFINKQSHILQVEDLGNYYLVFYFMGNPNGVKLKKNELSTQQMNEIDQYIRNFVIKLNHEQR